MKTLRIIKKVLLILLITIVVLASGLAILTYFYQDDIKRFALNYVTNNFKTEIQVGEVDFSIIRTFPYASVILKDIYIKSGSGFANKDFKQNTDTLLTAKQLLLQFDLLKLLKKNYELQSIQLHQARAFLYFDKKGRNNFNILKETQDTTSLYLKLQQVKLLNTELNFINLAKETQLKLSTKEFKLSGDFYKEQYAINSKGELSIQSLKIQQVNYLKYGSARLKLTLDVKNNEYRISKGSISLGKLTFGVNGSYIINDESDQINLSINGNQLPLSDLLKSIPEPFLSNIKDLDASGFIDLTAEIKGGINYKTNPRIKLSFQLSEGQITNTKTNTKLQQLACKGTFDNGLQQNLNSTSLTLDTFYTILNDSAFYGNFSMVNFNHPLIQFKIKGDLNLAQWKSLLQIDTLENLQGIVSVNLQYLGRIKDLSQITAADYQNAIVKGKIDAYNVHLKFIKSPYTLQNLTGIFYVQNNDVKSEKITFKLNENSILLSGTFQNLIAYLMLEKQKLKAFLDINIQRLNLNEWSDNNNQSGFALPEDIYLNANLTIDELIYDKLLLKQLQSKTELASPFFYFNNTSFNTMDGSIICNGKITIDKQKKIKLLANGKLQQINIKKAFQTFDNFGQTFLIDKNISGKLTAEITFMQITWDSLLNVLDKDIALDGNFLITNGQLVEFEPIYDLADYISLSELRQIKFSDLKNDLTIKDRNIIIPNMEIKTNAFNIEISGEHSFDNEIEYRIKLLLREWLANKAKKNKKENSEFGIEENDGLGSTALYLIIKGTTDDYKITYDSKKMKEQVKESLKKEKQEIKQILKEELGLFKKDTVSSGNIIKQEELKKPKFKIEWDEDNPEKDRSE